MLECFDKYYSSIKGISKTSRLKRYVVRVFSNILLPVVFALRKKIVSNNKKNKNNLDELVIVTLTTFPLRIGRLWLVIESMRRQTIQPDKIILWLASSQFAKDDIPKSLQWYCKNYILEIRFVDEDLRSYKKFYYSLLEYPKDVIVTIDDDIFYKKNLLGELIETYVNYDKEAVVAHRGYDVVKTQNSLTSYRSWNKSINYLKLSSNIFHTSGGGTLYKKSFFDDRVLDKHVFIEKCLLADDVWLNIMLQLNGTPTVLLSNPSTLLPLNYLKNITLSKTNVSQNQNDIQIDNVLKYYDVNIKEVFNI